MSFDLNSVLTRQTSEKVAYKLGLDYPLEGFLPCTFALIISALPEKFQKFLNWGWGWGGGRTLSFSGTFIKAKKKTLFQTLRIILLL